MTKACYLWSPYFYVAVDSHNFHPLSHSLVEDMANSLQLNHLRTVETKLKYVPKALWLRSFVCKNSWSSGKAYFVFFCSKFKFVLFKWRFKFCDFKLEVAKEFRFRASYSNNHLVLSQHDCLLLQAWTISFSNLP